MLARNGKFVEKMDLSRYLLLVLMVFSSTFFIYKDFGIRMLWGYGVLGLLLGVQCVHNVLRRQWPGVSVIEAAFAVLVATVGISFLRPDANRTSDLTAYIIAMMISFGYLALAKPDQMQLRRLMQTAMVSALVFAGFVLICSTFRGLFWNGYYPILAEASKAYADRYIPRGYSPVLGGSCTYTDYIMMIGIGVFGGKFMAERGDKNPGKYLSLGVMALLVFAIAVVGRRGELLGVAAALVVLWILMGRGKGRWIRLAYLAGGAVAALGIVILLLPLLKEVDFLRRYVMTVEKLLAGQDITSGRTELYAQALELFLEKPVFGIGWGQFANHVTPEFLAEHGPDVANVHNIYLEFLCEVGITGAIFLIVPMFYLLVQTIRQFSRLHDAPGDTESWRLAVQLNTVSLTVQLFFLLVGMLDPCFSKLTFWAIYALAIKLFSCAVALEGYEHNDIFARAWSRFVKTITGLNKKRRI
mgnify:CR=1 FL=1